MSRAINNLKGRRFGRLIALYNSDNRNSAGDVMWKCLCICGRFVEIGAGNLKSGHTKSCGCLRRDTMKKIKYKHGETRVRTRLYGIWIHMKERCNSFTAENYKYYGEKGIKVCDEWKNNFIIFRSWALANGYQENLTIDRINNNGNYEPDNCQWITNVENAKKSWVQRKILIKEWNERVMIELGEGK